MTLQRIYYATAIAASVTTSCAAIVTLVKLLG